MRGDRSRFKSEFLLGRGKYRLTVTLTLTLIYFLRWVLQTGNYVRAIEFTVLCFQENLTFNPENKTHKTGRYCDVTCHINGFKMIEVNPVTYKFATALDLEARFSKQIRFYNRQYEHNTGALPQPLKHPVHQILVQPFHSSDHI